MARRCAWRKVLSGRGCHVQRTDAINLFETFHDLLGGLVGETFGYALTAIWTVAMVLGLRHRFGRWFGVAG